MSLKLSIKKGIDLKLAGAVADNAEFTKRMPELVAIVPDDFPGFIPKADVKEGDTVAIGESLLHDKRDEDIRLVSPISGRVKAVVRGERRKIERVVVENDGTDTEITRPLLEGATREEIRTWLKRSGLWALMRQRPYDIVPEGDSIPRDIFITGLDTAPLAVDESKFLSEDAEMLDAGVKLLSALTEGKIYIARRDDGFLPDIIGAEMIDVAGPHPSGNVGVHIANVAPVNKGETVWTMDLMTLWRMGLLAKGRKMWTAYVAVTGSEVTVPMLIETVVGAEIKPLLEGRIKDDNRHHRIISGNVLTGVNVGEDGYLRYPYRQITVIPEGDDVDEFMGWASISPKKMSTSRSFPSRFFGRMFNPDARLNGGRRAFIMSGEYDRYMPMDILSEYLLKAIMGRDIEQMERLGIYEVAPEDFALGEFADTSKIEAQKIVREGLDYLRKELG